jgi:GxxExxY protein
VTQRLSAEEINALSNKVIGAAIEVHRHLGPGLLENTYAQCLATELRYLGLVTRQEILLPLRYRDLLVENAYRIDLLIGDELVVEVKTVENLLPIHSAQLLTYLKLSESRLGLLINFNVEVLRNGVKRVVNGL